MHDNALQDSDFIFSHAGINTDDAALRINRRRVDDDALGDQLAVMNNTKDAVVIRKMFFKEHSVFFQDKDFFVVDTAEDVPPESFPDVYYPKESALYVFETYAGFLSDTNDLIGKKIDVLLVK